MALEVFKLTSMFKSEYIASVDRRDEFIRRTAHRCTKKKSSLPGSEP
jgi:hypothetical protein